MKIILLSLAAFLALVLLIVIVVISLITVMASLSVNNYVAQGLDKKRTPADERENIEAVSSYDSNVLTTEKNKKKN